MGCFLALVCMVVAALGVFLIQLRTRLTGLERRLQVLEIEGYRGGEVSTPAPSVAPVPPVLAREQPRPTPPAPLTPQPPTPAAQGSGMAGQGREATPEVVPEVVTEVAAASPISPVDTASEELPESWAPAQAKRPSVDWEQWIGIRGAAVLGGLVLALAGLFFVKHSIDAGWISPSVRVALAFLAGVACLGFSSALARRYQATSNALGGTGLVLLYAGCWAGHVLYGLIHAAVAFGLMSLVTLLGGWLAWGRRSQVMAVLGLLGGFATPAFLSSLEDQPIQVFGYLLLLDVGLLFLGSRRRWPVLGGLAMAGTLLYQVVWLLRGGSEERLLLSLAVIALFGMLFAASTVLAGERREQPAEGLRSGVVALLAAFALAGMLALQSDALASHLLAYGGLLALLGLAAQSLSILTRSAVLGFSAAAATVISLLAIVVRHGDLLTVGTTTFAFSLVAVAFALPIFVLRRWKPQFSVGQAVLAAAIASGGVAGVALIATWTQSADEFYFVWLAVAAVAVGLHLALALASGRESLVTFGGLGLGFGLATTLGVEVGSPLLVAGGAGLLSLLGNFLPLPEKWRKPAQYGSILVLALPFLGFALSEWRMDSLSLSATATAIVGWTLLLATGAALWRAGWVYSLTVVLATVASLLSTLHWVGNVEDSSSVVLVGLLLFVTLLVSWPFLWRRRFAEAPFAWYGAVAALPLLVPVLYAWLDQAQFESWRGALFCLLAVIAGGAFVAAGRLEADAPKQRERALIGFGAVGLCFAALGVALFFGGQWLTVALALQGAALIGLWRRFDHPVLKYLALALFAVATVRLIAGPWTLRYLAGPEGVLWNGISYAYLVPAALLLLGLYWLNPLETERARPFEQFLYRSGMPWAAKMLGAAAIGVAFTWINMIITNAFRAGPELIWAAGRNPARDLTQSLAWTIFAVVLLSLGITARSKGLRWASLITLVVTIGKVFLFDLGELQDLHRVFSLLGLAVALILVSLVYQRFVFRTEAEPNPSEPPE